MQDGASVPGEPVESKSSFQFMLRSEETALLSVFIRMDQFF